MGQVDDPFKPPDATVLRPRPGAGRRGAPDASMARPPRVADVEPLPPATRESLGAGLNPLVRAAAPLLMLTGQIRGSLAAPDLDGLRRHALDEIRLFEDRARSAGIQQEVVLAARYVLCAGLDEAVLSTPWGGQSEWAQRPLLVMLHREAWGGEKFFEMLDRMSADVQRHGDLLELQYLCLALGFAGKYQVASRGQERLAEIQHKVYRTIRDRRDSPTPALSLRWRGVQDRRNPLLRYVPWWVAGAAGLAVVAVVFLVSYSRLASAAAPVQAALATVGLDTFTAPSDAPAPSGPTLKQLLAPEESAGRLLVEEQGARTRVTLLAPDLFGSGSAQPNASYAALLQRVAAALNQTPGRILVVGHTDDQALRSLQYRNNVELSRERAVGIASLLQRSLANPARVEWTGVGSTEPRYRPESTPENRARNRRVEIIHVSGS